jgi:hypothetical protein
MDFTIKSGYFHSGIINPQDFPDNLNHKYSRFNNSVWARIGIIHEITEKTGVKVVVSACLFLFQGKVKGLGISYTVYSQQYHLKKTFLFKPGLLHLSPTKI